MKRIGNRATEGTRSARVNRETVYFDRSPLVERGRVVGECARQNASRVPNSGTGRRDRRDHRFELADVLPAAGQQVGADQVLTLGRQAVGFQGLLVLADPVLLALLQRREYTLRPDELGGAGHEGGERTPRAGAGGRFALADPHVFGEGLRRPRVVVADRLQARLVRRVLELRPDVITMDPDVKKRVDALWKQAGL